MRPGPRLVLRGVAWGMAILALVLPFAGSADLAAALCGVGLGLGAGEVALRSGVRSRWIVGAALLALGTGPLVAALLTGTGLARLLGPGLALSLAGWSMFGVYTATFTGAFRALGARHDGVRGLEAVVLAACVASAFAAHRDGAVGRPLAVADLAWTFGVDPRTLLWAIGGVAAVLLLALLAAEHAGRVRRSALLALPLLLVVGGLVVRGVGVVRPPDPVVAEAGDGGLPREAPQVPPADAPRREDGAADAGASEGGGPPQAEDGLASPTELSEAAPAPGDAEGAPGGTEPQAPDRVAPPPGAAAEAPERAAPRSGAAPGAPPPAARPELAPDGRPVAPAEAAKPGTPATTPDAGDAGDAAIPAGGAGQAPMPPGADAAPPAGGGPGPGGAPPATPSGGPPAGPPPATPPSPDDAFDGGAAGNSPQPVAVVVLDDDFEPTSERWYLRQGALSVFNGHRLVPASPDSGLDRDLLTVLPTAEQSSATPPPADLRFPLTGTVAILVDHPAPFAPDFPVSYAPLANPDPTRFLRAWRFTSSVNPVGFEGLLGHTASGPELTAGLRQAYLTAPADPRYRELADEILAGLSAHAVTDPMARALAVKRWLDDHMIGDSTHRHEGDGDPTADFLFGDLHGYCVHGAHASVYLDRLLGVPSRIGVGYAVPASDRRGATLVVRGHQAHAWPEIWLDGVGWVAVDPTPREVLDAPAPPLDEEVARQLGELARHVPEAAEVAPTVSDWIRELMPAVWALLDGLWALVQAGALLVVAGVYGAKLWFGLAPRMSGAQAQPRVAYRAALHRLTSVGLGRQAGESREGHARRVARVAPSMVAITAAHVAAAFAREGSAGPDVATWRAWVRAVRMESAAATPWWRRALGWIDPTTPFRTR